MTQKADLKPLGEIAELARKKDLDGAVSRALGFAVALASEVPVLGKLVEESSRAIFERSARGRMRMALTALQAETNEELRRKAIASAVIEALKGELYGLRVDQQAIADALLRLDDRLAELHQAASAGAVEVHQIKVADGATGLELTGSGERAVKATQNLVTGQGTIGVRIKD